ncbi:COG0683 ABC-type branched-chain amino acid transport systems [Vibrio sp. B1FLJ16]|nr:COG0683 ABC-type branched-chain amino acid transport systems [Vibrio sp. B1FLJ16]CAE6904512.1 COG0683 ABC-type branched-chain amino acid transport systems [Vibrio sp. B1FLJ16]
MKRNFLATSVLAASLLSGYAMAEDTIKVGVLHSLSGTMAISETTLKDTMLMLIDEQNKKRWFVRQKAGGGSGRSGFRLAFVCGKSA